MIFDATLGAQVNQVPISFSGAGDNVVVQGLIGQTIRVLQFFLVIGAATDIIYKSGANALSGTMHFTTNAAQDQDYIQLPLHCNPGDSFIINSSNAVTIGGILWFIQS